MLNLLSDYHYLFSILDDFDVDLFSSSECLINQWCC